MIREQLEKLRQMDADRCLFLLGNIFLVFGVIAAMIITVLHIPLGTGGDCIFHKFTGLYCIGCGGTRAMLSFFRGDIFLSMKYHVFTAYGLSCFFLFMGSHYLSILTKDRIKGMHFRLIYVIIAVVLLIGQFIIRNIMLVKYQTILWPVGI